MPKPNPDEKVIAVSESVSMDRVAKLLALLVARDNKQNEQIDVLSRVGFSNTELAQILGTTAAVVSQTLYAIRKAPKKRKKKE